MIRPVAFLKWCGGLALIAAAAAFAPSSAAADSFAFSYSTGQYGPYHGPYHDHPYWGPRYHSSVVVVSPPPVYYPPPPAVVYVPVPVAPAAPVVTPTVDATPSSVPYRTADGQYCREYTTTTRVDGVPRSSYGTACLQPDGSWRIVN